MTSVPTHVKCWNWYCSTLFTVSLLKLRDPRHQSWARNESRSLRVGHQFVCRPRLLFLRTRLSHYGWNTEKYSILRKSFDSNKNRLELDLMRWLKVSNNHDLFLEGTEPDFECFNTTWRSHPNIYSPISYLKARVRTRKHKGKSSVWLPIR